MSLITLINSSMKHLFAVSLSYCFWWVGNEPGKSLQPSPTSRAGSSSDDVLCIGLHDVLTCMSLENLKLHREWFLLTAMTVRVLAQQSFIQYL